MNLREIRKICTKCNEEQPLDAFYVDRSRIDGKTTQCKQCRSEYSASVWKEWKKNATPLDRMKLKEKKQQWNRNIKQQILDQYGSVCWCCGEHRIEFLGIDHVLGNGRAHRRQIKITGGSRFYYWLRRNNYPPEYQVMCHNCNMSKGMYGYCPHIGEELFG